MLTRISKALDSEIVSLGHAGPMHLRVTGGARLSGSIGVKSSKNAGVALLCAALLNSGRTTLRKVARIEEVNRILEVLNSIGVRTRWLNDDNDLEIVPPDRRRPGRAWTSRRPGGPAASSCSSARCCTSRTRFELPYAGGCALGTRTVEPHLTALRPFGLEVKATDGDLPRAGGPRRPRRRRPIVLTERGDTVTENALMAAARHPGVDRDPQRQLQLHGAGPVLLPGRAGRADRRRRHHHAHRARRGQHRP